MTNREPGLEARVTVVEHRQNLLETRVEELSRETKAIFIDIGIFFEDHGRQIDKLEKSVVALREDLATKATKEDVAAVREEVAVVRGDVAAVREEVATIRGEMAGMRVMMATKKDIAGIHEELSTINRNMASVLAQILTLMNTRNQPL